MKIKQGRKYAFAPKKMGTTFCQLQTQTHRTQARRSSRVQRLVSELGALPPSAAGMGVGGGFRNSYNMVIGKMSDGMGGALMCPD